MLVEVGIKRLTDLVITGIFKGDFVSFCGGEGGRKVVGVLTLMLF